MAFSNGIFYSASDFYKSVFGKKVYKVSIDAGCTCPNRDGTKGTEGCIFCSQDGSGDFIEGRKTEIKSQIERNKSLVRGKIDEPAFIAYFQSFTNTYGSPEKFSRMYFEAASVPDVVGISIGTRPDCLSDEIISVLKTLSEKTFVILELGFQTSNEKTAAYINRCYENDFFVTAVRRINQICPKIHVVCHIIFGLPFEKESDMLSTVEYALRSGVTGLKISLLYVLKNTRLAEIYEKGLFSCMEMEEYFSILGKALKMIPKNIVLHRITGDGPKNLLIAPKWTENKRFVINSMMKYFRENGIVQGNGLD